jgi:hypothetical protein
VRAGIFLAGILSQFFADEWNVDTNCDALFNGARFFSSTQIELSESFLICGGSLTADNEDFRHELIQLYKSWPELLQLERN